MYLDDLQELTDDYVKSANKSLTPKFIWKPFIRKLLDGVVNYNIEQQVYVHDVKFFKELALILAETDDDLLGNSIIFQFSTFKMKYIFCVFFFKQKLQYGGWLL